MACRVLIIDEISMVSGALFEAVDAVGRAILDAPADRLFGGVQVLVFGDFLQLPPVTVGRGAARDYAFRARPWAELKFAVRELTASHRQSADPGFANLLREARLGRLSCDGYLALRERVESD